MINFLLLVKTVKKSSSWGEGMHTQVPAQGILLENLSPSFSLPPSIAAAAEAEAAALLPVEKVPRHHVTSRRSPPQRSLRLSFLVQVLFAQLIWHTIYKVSVHVKRAEGWLLVRTLGLQGDKVTVSSSCWHKNCNSVLQIRYTYLFYFAGAIDHQTEPRPPFPQVT